MKTNLLNCIGDIRPGEGEVPKCPGKTPICSGICHWCTLSLRELALCVNWSGAGLAVSHPSSLQDIKPAGEGVIQQGEAQQ